MVCVGRKKQKAAPKLRGCGPSKEEWMVPKQRLSATMALVFENSQSTPGVRQSANAFRDIALSPTSRAGYPGMLSERHPGT
jgi:hypothetical protein